MFRNHQPGFTLVELLVTMVILLLIVSFGVVLSIQTLKHQEIHRAADITRSELVTAQSYTVSGTNETAWGVAFFGNRIVKFAGTSYASRIAAYDHTSLFGSTINISGATEVNFTRPEGTPPSPTTLLITDGTSTYTITVATTGSITVSH